jgi:hypothetical protein
MSFHGNARSTSTGRHHLIMAAIGITFALVTPARPAAAASPVPAQNDMVYWVCQASYYQKPYVSDVIPVPAAQGIGAMNGLHRQFRHFLTAKYQIPETAGSSTCTPFTEAARAQAIVDGAVKPASGTAAVATGWKPETSPGAPAPAPPGAHSAGPAAAAPAPPIPVAPAQTAPAPPVTTDITVRLVDAVNSSTYQAGKRYRAVVTRAVTAGRVQIPESALAAITLVQQSPGTFSAQLVSIRVDGQHMPVTSTPVNLESATEQTTNAVGGLLSGLGHHGHAGQVASAVNSAAARLAIPPGTTLTLSTSVPQPDVPGGSVAQAGMAAPGGGDELPNGELGADGAVIGGTASGVLTAYSCYAQTFPPGKHRQTSYVTAPFNSAQPQRWITFWFSQYIHQTYNIPADVARFTIECNSLGNKTPAQQQATVNAAINSWKQHDNDVVSIDWAPTQTPTPGISVAQLNPMTGQMTTGGFGSNLPAATNAANAGGSASTAQATPPGYVLCTTNRSYDSKAYASAIFKGRTEDARAIEQAFLTYLAAKYGPNVPHNTSCPARQYLADAQSYLFSMKNQAPGAGITVVETGWTYKGAAPAPVSGGGAGADAEESAGSGGGQDVLCYSEPLPPSMYFSANFHIDVPPPPGPHSGHTDNGRSAKALGALKDEFVRFLQKQYGFRPTSAYPAYCDGQEPDQKRQILRERFPQVKAIETGWKPGAAPAPPAANVPAAHVNRYSAVGGSYSGTYVCAKGPIDMTLNLALNESSILNGTMTFYLPPGSHTKAYTFSLGGPLNQTSGTFNLRPMKWETAAPPNYVLVGLIGTVDPQTGRVSGHVDSPGCSKFEAMKGREE